MRGDKQWFDDTVKQADLATVWEHAMLDMGLDVRQDVGFSAWYHFQQVGPLAKQHRYDCQPVWMGRTFAAYGECCCEIKTPCPIHGMETVWD